MRRYLDKLIWKPIVASFIIISIGALLLMPLMQALIMISCVLFLCTAYFVLNRTCQYLFKASGPSSYFQDLGWRNADAIVVGSTMAWRYTDFSGLYYYNATGFKRSNSMNFNMLKTYYSHLKKNGTIFFVVDPLESQQLDEYISPCDFQQIHPHIFLKLGITYSEERKYNPLLFDRVYSIQFITAYFTRKFYSSNAICWRPKNSIKELSKVYEDKLLQELKDLANYCNERELKCQIVLIQQGYQSIEHIYDQVQNWADVVMVSSPRELNTVIRA